MHVLLRCATVGYDTYTQQTEGAVMVDISRLDVYNADERNGRDEDVLERKYVSRVSGREREKAAFVSA